MNTGRILESMSPGLGKEGACFYFFTNSSGKYNVSYNIYGKSLLGFATELIKTKISKKYFHLWEVFVFS
ncbi:hypothetical protein CH361_14515 [Leptospira brenneri]|nr:hypothetical protein CH361_14515 [Leptospira brenneri]